MALPTASGALVLLAATAAPALPRPTGSFPVGRVAYHWTDPSRRDVLAPDAAAPRELMVDVWYPAQAGTGSPADYLPFDTGAIAGFEQPFLLFTRPRPSRPPTDEELAAMGLTRAALEPLLRKLDAAQDAALQSAGRGSYRVTLSMPGVSHGSFSDQPVLQAADDTARRDEAVRNLETIRACTRAFFDKSLRGARNTSLDRPRADPTVKVESFPGDARAPRGTTP